MSRKSVDVGLFGQSAAGKTVYLTMLVHSIQKSYNRRYYVRFNNHESEKYITDRIREIVEYGEWPSATIIHGEESVVFEIVSHNQQHFIRYRTTDLPGEIIHSLFVPGTDGTIWQKELFRQVSPYKKYVKKICSIIKKSNAFFFLIAPNGDTDENKRLFDQKGQDLMCATIIDEIIDMKEVISPEEMPPIAFVFTKWDAYSDSILDFEEYARRVLKMTFGCHKPMLKNSKIMKCSGVGNTRIETIPDNNGTRKVLKPKKPIQPMGIAEGLFWVIRNSRSIESEVVCENGNK